MTDKQILLNIINITKDRFYSDSDYSPTLTEKIVTDLWERGLIVGMQRDFL